MEILLWVVFAYTAVMFVIHVSSWKLLRKWDAPGDSWIKRRFSAQTALRVEAVYWLLLVVTWPLWPSAGWETVVIVFAVIHISVWLMSEGRVIREDAASKSKTHRYIVAFDAVEAGALIAIAWSTVLYMHRG
ncbi:MAG: hypothetical protein ACRD3F_01795 [Acidobacteriaceae bacterium]